MDNLTHSLVGLAASKAGLEKLSPGATLLCVIATNAPDADIVVRLFGDRWLALHHHRGITHSILGTLIIGLTIPLGFFLIDRLISKMRAREPTTKLKGMMIASVVVCATHPLLDWTNNYGIRPLLPWSSQWFYGDLIFIIDPFLWLVLGGAAFLTTSKTKLQVIFWLVLAGLLTFLIIAAPSQRGFESTLLLRAYWVVGLIAIVILFRLRAGLRWGSRILIMAFVVIAVYAASLSLIHRVAIRNARILALGIASQSGESVTDVAAMPTLANPLRWLSVAETERAAYRFEVHLGTIGGFAATPVRYERADILSSPALARAMQDRRAKIFLDFARFPVARVVDPDCMTQTLVQLADLRYTEPGRSRGTFTLEVPIECPISADEQQK